MWCAISARRSSNRLPETAWPSPRLRAWAAPALGIALVGLALVAMSPSRFGHGSLGMRRGAIAPDELLAALALQRAPEGTVMPGFALRSVEGQPVTAEGLRGKVVLMSFFATWCPSCRAEMPALRYLAARLQGTDFVLLLVSYGEAPATVRSMAGDLAFAHGVLLDPRAHFGDRLGVKFLPTHFLIGRRGELLATGVGPKAWDTPEAVRLIGSLL